MTVLNDAPSHMIVKATASCQLHDSKGHSCQSHEESDCVQEVGAGKQL